MKQIILLFLFHLLSSFLVGQEIKEKALSEYKLYVKNMDLQQQLFLKQCDPRMPHKTLSWGYTSLEKFESQTLSFYNNIFQLRQRSSSLQLNEYDYIDSLINASIALNRQYSEKLCSVFEREDFRSDLTEFAKESSDYIFDKISFDEHEWLINEILNSGYKLPRENLPSCEGSLKFILFEENKFRSQSAMSSN